jgi:hypothetical protein
MTMEKVAADDLAARHGSDHEFFLHANDAEPKIGKGAPHETLREVLIRVGIIEDGGGNTLVFVGECDVALRESDEIEDGVDKHEPVDISLTLEVLEVHRHRHVHCHTCRHIAVEVNFGGKTKRHHFSPATTVGVVTEWARRKFKLDPESASEYVLQICGTTTQPRSDEHLGKLVDAPVCSLCFNLVKEVSPQG